MVKHWVIAAFSALAVGAVLVAILFLITLPQVEPLASEVIANYNKISSTDFQFVEDKYYVKELLSKEYAIDYNSINSYINNKQYKPGNYDPFTPASSVQTATNNSSSSNSQNNTNNSNSTGTGSSTANTNNGQVINGTNK